MAISGTTIVVGDPGHAFGGRAYVFSDASKALVWNQAASLSGPATACQGECRPGFAASFGNSVAVSGSTSVVGALGALGSSPPAPGRAYVFEREARVWHQAGVLTGTGS